MTINAFSAKDAIVEALDYDMPEDENAATDSASEALHAYIDNGLIYYRDILQLWDGNTHAEVFVEEGADIMDLVTQSTYFQLCEEWDWAIYDAIDEWLNDHPAKIGHEEWEDLDRAERFDAIGNALSNSRFISSAP